MNEFHGTAAQELIKNTILSFSGVALAAAVYLIIYDIKVAAGKKSWGRVEWLGRAGTQLCFLGIIGLLFEAIYTRDEPLSIEWRVLLYTGLIIGFGVSSALIIVAGYMESKKNKDRGRYL